MSQKKKSGPQSRPNVNVASYTNWPHKTGLLVQLWYVIGSGAHSVRWNPYLVLLKDLRTLWLGHRP